MERPQTERLRYLAWVRLGIGSVGLKQQLRDVAYDCGLEAESHVWKAVESVACLVRVWGQSHRQLFMKSGAIGVDRFTPVMRHGVVNAYGALANLAVVTRVPGDGAWLRCPAGSSGGMGGSRLSDVGVSCRASRRRRGRCDRRVGKAYSSYRGPAPAGCRQFQAGRCRG